MSQEVCKETKFQLVAIIAGILIIVGAFLPWFIIGNDETTYELNWKGIEHDGETLELPGGQLALQSLFWALFILFGIMMILTCSSEKPPVLISVLVSYMVYLAIFSYLYLVAVPSLEETLYVGMSYGWYLFFIGTILYILNVYQVRKEVNNG